MSDNIDKVLAQRGARYGDFSHHAELAQNLQEVMRSSGVKVSGEFWNKLTAVQKQALTVIADKIARILSGDPNYDDNWIDIQGYAKLVQERITDQRNNKVMIDLDKGVPLPAQAVAEGWTLMDVEKEAYRVPVRALKYPYMNRGDI